jgi:hypothetical protein
VSAAAVAVHPDGRAVNCSWTIPKAGRACSSDATRAVLKNMIEA